MRQKADATLGASRSRKPSVKRNRNRGALPPHLPRIERVIEPASTLRPCGCGEMAKIGEDVAQRLDLIPAQLRVLVTQRPRYACRRCSGAVAQAHAPEHVVPGGLPTEALISHVIVSKFGDHLPFHRQAEILPAPARRPRPRDARRLGGTRLLPPQADRRADAGPSRPRRPAVHGQDPRPGARSGARKTHIGPSGLASLETARRAVSSGQARTAQQGFWAIPADDRGHGGAGPPIALFRYAPTRAGAHAERFLEGFRGRLLQCDGYDGYNRLTRLDRPEGGWTLVHCWSHVRRRFVKVMQATPSPVAETMLRHIGALYAIEKTVRGRPPEERLKARREHAAPIVAALKPWLEAQLSRISRGSKLAEHIAYTLGCWTGLTRFLADGRLELDTNPVENLIRPLALTRKNSLFAGHEIGAENWALLASLVATCKLNDVEPVAYIAATLRAIIDGHPQSRIDEFMPWRFTTPSTAYAQGIG